MKKVISLLMVAALTMGLSVSAFASAESEPQDEDLVSFVGPIGHLLLVGDHVEIDESDLTYTTIVLIDGDGVNEEYSNMALLNDGATVTAEEADGLDITDSTTALSSIIIDNADYTIKDATIIMDTDSDGTLTNDFTGMGAIIAIYGDSNVEISDSYIEGTGVGIMPVFIDSSVDEDGNDLIPVVTIDNTTLVANGGTMYEDYENQHGAHLMVAPPWILGIMGNARCLNLEGEYSTLNVMDSDVSAAAWAVLSTDQNEGCYMNVVNTTLTLTDADESAGEPFQEEGGQMETKDNPYTTNYGPGYGTYAGGYEDAITQFLGCDINVGTYAVIFTAGNVVFGSLEPNEEIELKAGTGNEEDSVYYTYTGDEEKNTVINSDTFGMMFHEQKNTASILPGTEINSGYATFLVKSGKEGVIQDPELWSKSVDIDVTVDGASINNGGVLIQVMDDDDSSTGNDPDNFYLFNTVHEEEPGFADSNSTTADLCEQRFTFTNGDYTGNIYNSSGSDRCVTDEIDVATTLDVTLGEGATLSGAIATTRAIHVTYDGSVALKEMGGNAFDTVEDAAEFVDQYQNLEFTISEYYDIGHVANLIGNTDGANDINVTMTDDAVWNVTSTSVVDTLTIEGDATVNVPTDVSLTVGDTVYTDTVLTADSF